MILIALQKDDSVQRESQAKIVLAEADTEKSRATAKGQCGVASASGPWAAGGIEILPFYLCSLNNFWVPFGQDKCHRIL